MDDAPDWSRLKIRVRSPDRSIMVTMGPMQEIDLDYAPGGGFDDQRFISELATTLERAFKAFNQAASSYLDRARTGDPTPTQLERAEEFGRRIDTIEVTETSPRGLVRCVWLGSGPPVIQTRPGSLSRAGTNPQQLAHDVTACYEAARNRYLDCVSAIDDALRKEYP